MFILLILILNLNYINAENVSITMAEADFDHRFGAETNLSSVVTENDDIISNNDMPLNRSWTEFPRSFEDAFNKAKNFFGSVHNDAFTRVFAAIYANVIIIIVIYAVIIIRNVHKSLQYLRYVRRTSFMRSSSFIYDDINPFNADQFNQNVEDFVESKELHSLKSSQHIDSDSQIYDNVDSTMESVFDEEANAYEVPKTSGLRSILQNSKSFSTRTPNVARHVSFSEVVSREFMMTPSFEDESLYSFKNKST